MGWKETTILSRAIDETDTLNQTGKLLYEQEKAGSFHTTAIQSQAGDLKVVELLFIELKIGDKTFIELC